MVSNSNLQCVQSSNSSNLQNFKLPNPQKLKMSSIQNPRLSNFQPFEDWKFQTFNPQILKPFELSSFEPFELAIFETPWVSNFQTPSSQTFELEPDRCSFSSGPSPCSALPRLQTSKLDSHSNFQSPNSPPLWDSKLSDFQISNSSFSNLFLVQHIIRSSSQKFGFEKPHSWHLSLFNIVSLLE